MISIAFLHLIIAWTHPTTPISFDAWMITLYSSANHSAQRSRLVVNFCRSDIIPSILWVIWQVAWFQTAGYGSAFEIQDPPSVKSPLNQPKSFKCLIDGYDTYHLSFLCGRNHNGLESVSRMHSQPMTWQASEEQFISHPENINGSVSPYLRKIFSIWVSPCTIISKKTSRVWKP